jgi:hypothetical protein
MRQNVLLPLLPHSGEEDRSDPFVLVVDELAGREVARQCGLTILGTLGILVRAKEERLCQSVAPLLDRLQNELKFFVSSSVRDMILRQAGE